MRWQSIGTGIFNPVAFSPRTGYLSLLCRGRDNDLVLRELREGAWSQPTSFGVPVAGVDGSIASIPVDWPLAVCPSGGRWPHLLARGPDGELLHLAGGEGGWQPRFDYVGAPSALAAGTLVIPMALGGPPTACGRDSERVDVFAAGQGGSLLHAIWDGQDWREFESLGAPTLGEGEQSRLYPLSGPVSCCRSGDQIAVFTGGPVGDLLMKWWDGNEWSRFESLGSPKDYNPSYPAVTIPAPLSGPPVACSWGAGRLDVFARGPHGDMLHRGWDGERWGQFESLGMPTDARDMAIPFVGTATACTWGTGRLDVFARAVDGHLYHTWWDGSWEHG
jgi:hypothetical protein